jgi:hypothetical protein
MSYSTPPPIFHGDLEPVHVQSIKTALLQKSSGSPTIIRIRLYADSSSFQLSCKLESYCTGKAYLETGGREITWYRNLRVYEYQNEIKYAYCYTQKLEPRLSTPLDTCMLAV